MQPTNLFQKAPESAEERAEGPISPERVVVVMVGDTEGEVVLFVVVIDEFLADMEGEVSEFGEEGESEGESLGELAGGVVVGEGGEVEVADVGGVVGADLAEEHGEGGRRGTRFVEEHEIIGFVVEGGGRSPEGEGVMGVEDRKCFGSDGLAGVEDGCVERLVVDANLTGQVILPLFYAAVDRVKVSVTVSTVDRDDGGLGTEMELLVGVGNGVVLREH